MKLRETRTQSGKEKWHQLNVTIPLHLMEKLRHVCEVQGVSLTEYVTDAVATQVVKDEMRMR